MGSNAEVVGLGVVAGVNGGEGDGPSSESEMSMSSVSKGGAGNSYGEAEVDAVEDDVVVDVAVAELTDAKFETLPEAVAALVPGTSGGGGGIMTLGAEGMPIPDPERASKEGEAKT